LQEILVLIKMHSWSR